MHSRDEVVDANWHKNVPLEVSICEWRLLCNRWPKRDNLVRRDIIPSDSHFVAIFSLLILRETSTSSVVFAAYLTLQCLSTLE